MNKRYLRFSILALAFPLSACGYALKEVYKGDAYNSPIFANNYYRVHDKALTGKSSEHSYSLGKDDYFSSFDSAKFASLDPEGSALTYTTDLPNKDNPENTLYGQSRKMTNYSDIFSYGYISKLFDGQMFCNAKYQLARVQIDEDGFARSFSKEGKNFSYFAINLKSSFDYTAEDNPAPNNIISEVDLKIDFFFKSSEGIGKFDVTLKELKVPTNTGDGDRNNAYVFAGFDFASINQDYLSRICGFGISYTYKTIYKNKDLAPYTNEEKEKIEELDHSLMIYEVFLPGTTWR